MYLLHKSDDEIIEKAKEFKLYKVLFVFDECHNFFKSKQDDVLVWWLTYHGHIYHEIILITQDMSLLSKEYKTQGEQFYKAIPQTYRMSKKVFKYSLYSTYGMYQKDYISSTTIKPEKEIFDMYVSGDTVDSKSILHKYIYLFFSLLILCIFSFIFVIDSFSNEEKDGPNIDKKESINNDKEVLNDNEDNTDTKIYDYELSDLKYMRLKCNTKLNFCLYKNKKINTNFYLKMKQLQDFQEISITPFMKDFVYLEVFVTDTFYSIYNKELNNEKNNTNSPSFFTNSTNSN